MDGCRALTLEVYLDEKYHRTFDYEVGHLEAREVASILLCQLERRCNYLSTQGADR
jgi:hypothetical protein